MRARLAAALLLACSVALPALPVLPAHAAVGLPVAVVIDGLAPLAPQADGAITLTGRVVNTSAEAVQEPVVRLRVSSHPLADRAAVDEVLAAPDELAAGNPDDVPLDHTRRELGAALGPGEQRPFTIVASVADLQRRDLGVYALGVEVLGARPGLAATRQGEERTVLPLLGDRPSSVGITWLWPLAERPDRDANGVFLSDALPTALAPGGRLSELLDVGANYRDDLTWVVDPALLQSAAAIAEGYQVMRGTEIVVGDRAQAGRRWLDQLRDAVRTRSLHVLPYANVDAVAAQRAGLGNDVVLSVTSAPAIGQQAIGRRVTGDLAWAASGRYDKATANLLATAGVDTVVLAAGGMPPRQAPEQPSNGIADYGTSVGPVNGVLVDERLSAILAAPQSTTADIVQARQRFLAETAIVAQQARSPIVLAVAPSDLRWHPARRLVEGLLQATGQASWLRPASLGQLLAADRVPRARQPYGTAARRQELPAEYLAAVARTERRVAQMAAVLDDPAETTPPFTAALLRAQSASWRDDVRGGRRLVTAIDGEIRRRITLVHALSTGTVTFSGDSGKVPVTIANDGDQPVTVGLALVGVPEARLVSEPLSSIEIGPGKKVSVEVEARVLGGEPLTLKVQLLTPDGSAYGPPATITLTSTAYARAAAWVMGLAFAGIAVFVVIGVARRIHAVHTKRMAR